MIVNDASGVIHEWRHNLECHLWSSITLPGLSIMLLEIIYSTGITHDDHNMFIVQATLHVIECLTNFAEVFMGDRIVETN